VIIEFRAKPTRIDAVKAWMSARLPQAREFAGCESVLAVQDQDDPRSIILTEQFASRRQYEAYLHWRNHSGTVAELVELIDGPITFRFCNLVGI
jgi:quinol monooxygenase YgiN